MKRYDLKQINIQAEGRWKDILSSILHLSEIQLSKKGQPCPMCGGKDRYSFTNKFCRGDYYCRGCGPGNGWTLIMKLKGCTFYEALNIVGDYIN